MTVSKCIAKNKSNKEEQRDVLEHFANIFTVLNHTNFHDIFHPHFNNNTRKPSCLTLLYKSILKNHYVINIPQHFLTNPRVTGVFTGILFDFLLEPKQLLLLAATRESKCTKYDRIEDLESKRIGLKSTIDGRMPTLIMIKRRRAQIENVGYNISKNELLKTKVYNQPDIILRSYKQHFSSCIVCK